MKFSQVLTLVALATGPAGVWLGWFLNERGAEKRAMRSEQAEARAGDRERALSAVQSASDAAAGARTIAHGVVILKTRGKPENFLEQLEAFNDSRDSLRLAVLRLRLLGPAFAVAPTQEVMACGQRLTERLMSLQQRFNSSDLAELQNQLKEIDDLVRGLADQVSQQYNPGAASLPDHPILDPE